MKEVYIDIETIPTQNEAFKFDIASEVKAPATHKKQETIGKWFRENGDAAKAEAIHRTSFDGGAGEIFCIGLDVDDKNILCKRSDLLPDSEKLMLTEFNDAVSDLSGINNPHFIGHYISDFDLRFIYHRMIVHKVKPKFHFPVNDAVYKGSFTDTMYLWAGAKDRVSLKNLCKYLGVGCPKGDLDGSRVWEFVQAGRWQEVWDYCLEDVKAVKECHKRITFA